MMIDELHDKLRKSQDSYYGGDIKYRLSVDEHWRTWDLMYEFERKQRNEMEIDNRD